MYDIIKNLNEEKLRIESQGRMIKHDKTKREDYVALCEKYEKIYELLRKIEIKFAITCQDLEKIISKATGQQFKLKIFRETYTKDGKTYLTHRFIACYLNQTNKFFDYNIDGFELRNLWCAKEETYVNYSLAREQFAELKNSLNETNSFMLADSDEFDFIPILTPSSYIEKINYMSLFTFTRCDKIVSDNFIRMIKPVLQKELECIYPENINLQQEKN